MTSIQANHPGPAARDELTTQREKLLTWEDFQRAIHRTEMYLTALKAEQRKLAPAPDRDTAFTIDRSFSQLLANDESEPGRDYME